MKNLSFPISAVALCLAVFFLTYQPSTAQDDDPHAGARPPRPDMSLRRDSQYKRVHQVALRYILLDRLDEAESFLKNYLKGNPEDEETHYVMAILEAQRGDFDAAEEYAQKAIDLGLPAERFIAGPRRMFLRWKERDWLRNLIEELQSTPLHGPLIGQVTSEGAKFWVRTAVETEVTIVVSQQGDLSDPVAEARSLSSADADYTAVVSVHGLQPRQRYFYGVRLGGGEIHHSEDHSFQTFASTGESQRFRLAFGGGAGYVPPHERMWDTILEHEPDVMLLLGDNVYIDDPESVEMQQYTYQRRQSRPEWRRLTAQTPTFTIWDDHDFSTNDSWGGPLVDRPAWKLNKSWPIFQQNWANPEYAGGKEWPGCYYRFAIGDVDFLMLDCRYYRNSPRSDVPSMLGPRQMQWLKQELSSMTGTFKVLCSSVPWDFRTKGDSLDTWNGYQKEREEIFRYLEENQITGVLLMSADRHRSDAWKIERPNGYPLYEFNSSRLTNQHVHPTMEKAGAIFSYNAKQSFGLVTFDTTPADPTVRYEVVSIDGEHVHSIDVRRSELQVSE